MSLLTEHEQRTLVRMIQAVLPHDSIPLGPYERAADEVMREAAASPYLQAQLAQGLQDLDNLREVPFLDLADDVRLTVLRGIQDAPFFKSVLGIVVVKFYDDHEVWALLGYEGPSFDQGGYLHRGFDDLDWLPDPRIEEATS